jgi:DMSO/TMAO reductase YedYZ molybdopterin-dependent catalytic subunit
VTELGRPDEGITYEELQLATRNRGMPLEALRYPITPVGMHYLLVHFDVPELDDGEHRLTVGGNVDHQLELTMDDLRAMPARTMPVTLECAGNGRARLDPRPLSQPWLVEAIGTAEWTGTPLAGVLSEAGLGPDTVDVVFTGADRGVQGDVEQDYQRALSPSDAMREEVLLVYEMNGRPLEPQHGFPLRLVVPGWYGMTSVKWLAGIDAITERFEGYQQVPAYRFQQTEEEIGEPVTRMRVRALMIPPGIPDFFTRRRLIDAGRVRLAGRAWCGTAPVIRVEVGVDGEWSDATLEEPIGPWAWRGWSSEWNATPGEHVLSCRATDAEGNVQPLEQPWNLQGMANNLVQQERVTVR